MSAIYAIFPFFSEQKCHVNQFRIKQDTEIYQLHSSSGRHGRVINIGFS